MTRDRAEAIHEQVRAGYTAVAERTAAWCTIDGTAVQIARRVGYTEHDAGTIEALPLPDASVDVVLWNCVINLCPDKPLVFREAHCVLRPGGRLVVSDLVLEEPLAPALSECVDAGVGCLAGALLREDYLDAVRRAGFLDVRAVSEAGYGSVIDVQTPEIRAAAERIGVGEEALRRAVGAVTSVKIAARRRNGA